METRRTKAENIKDLLIEEIEEIHNENRIYCQKNVISQDEQTVALMDTVTVITSISELFRK